MNKKMEISNCEGVNKAAFILDEEKSEQFFKKSDKARKAIERYEQHKPNVGVRVPHKCARTVGNEEM